MLMLPAINNESGHHVPQNVLEDYNRRFSATCFLFVIINSILEHIGHQIFLSMRETHCNLSVRSKTCSTHRRSSETFETIAEDMIDTFLHTSRAVNQQFVRKKSN